MKITVKTRTPRNPLVAAARFRQAGLHRRNAGSRRHQAERELQREMERLKPSP